MCLNIVKSDSKTAAKHQKTQQKEKKGAQKESPESVRGSLVYRKSLLHQNF
jgi:hypothetical protein